MDKDVLIEAIIIWGVSIFSCVALNHMGDGDMAIIKATLIFTWLNMMVIMMKSKPYLRLRLVLAMVPAFLVGGYYM